jgi:hypothetical protein
VRLVDGEQRDLAAIQQLPGGVEAQPLRRQVQQIEFARDELRLDGPPLVGVLRGVEEACAHAQCAERVHLILHEGDQRGDHHPDAGAHQCGDLIAERLASAGRHEHQRVATVDHVLDDRLLIAAEAVVTEDSA